MAARYEGIN